MKTRKQWWLIGVNDEDGHARTVWGTWANRAAAARENDSEFDGACEIVCARNHKSAVQQAEQQAAGDELNEKITDSRRE